MHPLCKILNTPVMSICLVKQNDGTWVEKHQCFLFNVYKRFFFIFVTFFLRFLTFLIFFWNVCFTSMAHRPLGSAQPHLWMHQTQQSLFTTWKEHHSIFWIPSAFQNSEANTLNGDVKILLQGVGKLARFLPISLLICRKRYDTDLLLISDHQSFHC